jgi:hypothetical protein
MSFSTPGGIIEITGSSIVTAGGAISGAGRFHNSGTGSLRANGANDFSGIVQIDAGGGTMSLIGPNGGFVSASAITVTSGRTLELNNSSGNNADRIDDNAAVSFRGADSDETKPNERPAKSAPAVELPKREYDDGSMDKVLYFARDQVFAIYCKREAA